MTTSSRSTTPGSPASKRGRQRPVSGPPASAVFDVADDETAAEAQKDNAKASLETQLQQEKDRRVEERFGWLVVCVILVDVLWFRNAPNAIIPIVVLLLEAILLFIFAKRMGIEEIPQLFQALIHGISRSGQG